VQTCAYADVHMKGMFKYANVQLIN